MRGLTFYKTKQNKYNKHPKKSIVRKKAINLSDVTLLFCLVKKKDTKYIKIGSKRTKKKKIDFRHKMWSNMLKLK